MSDALALKTCEVLDREHRAARVIGQDTQRSRVVHLREDVDHRQIVGAQIDRRTPVHPARSDHQPVDLFAQQLVETLLLARRVVGGVAHENRDTQISELTLERFDDGE